MKAIPQSLILSRNPQNVPQSFKLLRRSPKMFRKPKTVPQIFTLFHKIWKTVPKRKTVPKTPKLFRKSRNCSEIPKTVPKKRTLFSKFKNRSANPKPFRRNLGTQYFFPRELVWPFAPILDVPGSQRDTSAIAENLQWTTHPPKTTKPLNT